MIPIVNIIYPIYKKQPKEFIIAGDPLQIEPITAVSDWKDENIYKMVKLNSFLKPHTEPYDYPVVLLDTQYRSIPAVGNIFSRLAYGGVLKHFRKDNDIRPLNISDSLEIAPLNIIRYPVSKYESIYKPQRLNHSSSYQVYSALFAYEFVSYLSNIIAKANVGENFSIGIIAPYKAEADMIDKLVNSMDIPQSIKIQVGTIHGFQGDECDIIIAIFNTPPSITASKEAFLNKLNIINVAISRARDYLIVIYPDDDTAGLENLNIINNLSNLITRSEDYKVYASPDLEAKMFGDSTYLEKNAFSTGHQSVNVYGAPEKKYEIRSEDSAVDIQIRKTLPARQSVFDKPEKIERKPNRATEVNTIDDLKVHEDFDEVEYLWLDANTGYCTYCSGTLVRKNVPVYKKNGNLKHLPMYVCTKCGKNFLVRSSLSNTVNLNDYCMHEKVNSSFNRRKVKSEDIVFNREFGKGIIIGRYYKNGKSMVTVKFRNAQMSYDEIESFKSGKLMRI